MALPMALPNQPAQAGAAQKATAASAAGKRVMNAPVSWGPSSGAGRPSLNAWRPLGRGASRSLGDNFHDRIPRGSGPGKRNVGARAPTAAPGRRRTVTPARVCRSARPGKRREGESRSTRRSPSGTAKPQAAETLSRKRLVVVGGDVVLHPAIDVAEHLGVDAVGGRVGAEIDRQAGGVEQAEVL